MGRPPLHRPPRYRRRSLVRKATASRSDTEAIREPLKHIKGGESLAVPADGSMVEQSPILATQSKVIGQVVAEATPASSVEATNQRLVSSFIFHLSSILYSIFHLSSQLVAV